MAGYLLNYQNAKAFCERQNFRFLDNAERGQLAVVYPVLEHETLLQILPFLDRSMVTFAMALPFVVPPSRFSAVSEALTRLNARIYMGTWVLNSDKGEVYFRVTLPALDNEWTDDALLFAARVVVSTTEEFARDLFALAQPVSPS
ncbi:MAG TPA: YbjN domain-containing protein [Pseudomonadota bacterium]|nr:YbjN domain-containing protein [Pseudomonadota bacterium]